MRPSVLTSAGTPVDIPARGLPLIVRWPGITSGHWELTQARLELGVPVGKTTLTQASDTLTLATNLGGWPAKSATAGSTEETETGVTWITADWGARRTLVSIQIKAATAGSDTQDPLLARLLISDGGPWFPAFPVDTIPFDKDVAVPDLVASRLRLEVVRRDSAGTLQPAVVELEGLSLGLARLLDDVTVAVGNAPPFYRSTGRLLAGQRAVVERGLLEALNAAAPKDGAAADSIVWIRDSQEGQVAIDAAQLTASTVFTALDASPLNRLSIDWEGGALGKVTIGEGVALGEVSFSLAVDLVPERILTEPSLVEASSYAHLCDPGHSAAQGFLPLGEEALAGVDLWLRPVSPKVSMTLALHPDDRGHPGPVPFEKATVLRELVAGPDCWCSFQLEKPLRLSAGPWWIVLTTATGEAHWPLGAFSAQEPRGTFHRLGLGAWTPWVPWTVPLSTPRALCRLRVSDPSVLPPPFDVKLSRGESHYTARATPGARFTANAPDLGTTKDVLNLALTSAGAPVAGTLRLADLRVVVHGAPE